MAAVTESWTIPLCAVFFYRTQDTFVHSSHSSITPFTLASLIIMKSSLTPYSLHVCNSNAEVKTFLSRLLTFPYRFSCFILQPHAQLLSFAKSGEMCSRLLTHQKCSARRLKIKRIYSSRLPIWDITLDITSILKQGLALHSPSSDPNTAPLCFTANEVLQWISLLSHSPCLASFMLQSYSFQWQWQCSYPEDHCDTSAM